MIPRSVYRNSYKDPYRIHTGIHTAIHVGSISRSISMFHNNAIRVLCWGNFIRPTHPWSSAAKAGFGRVLRTGLEFALNDGCLKSFGRRQLWNHLCVLTTRFARDVLTLRLFFIAGAAMNRIAESSEVPRRSTAQEQTTRSDQLAARTAGTASWKSRPR